MSLLNQSKYPKPSSWNEFEDMVVDVFTRDFQGMAVCRYGRQGQKQNGIDILAYNSTTQIGIQCKNIEQLDEKMVDDIISKIKLDLQIIYIASTTERDVTLINHATKITRDIGKIVQIQFWEDIVNRLVEGSFISKYYPQFFRDDFILAKDRELLADFYRDFNDSGLKDYLSELNPEKKLRDDVMLKLFELTDKWSQVDKILHYPDIELVRKEFISVINNLSNTISLETWSVTSEHHIVAEEWIVKQPERYRKVIDSLNMNLAKFIQLYENIIILAKRNNLL